MWLENKGVPDRQDDFPILVHFLKILFDGSSGGGEQWNKPQNPHTQNARKENLLRLALGQIQQIKENHLAIPMPLPMALPTANFPFHPGILYPSAPMPQAAQDIATIPVLYSEFTCSGVNSPLLLSPTSMLSFDSPEY